MSPTQGLSVPNDWNDSSIHLNYDKATMPSIKHSSGENG